MNDGDRTCRPEDVEKLVRPIIEGKADVVIGSRFDKIKPESGSTRSIQKFGNLAVAALTNILYHRRDLKDATCPSWAFKKDFLVNEHLTAKGFDLEAELLAKTIFGGYRLETVSVKQEKREGRSKFLGFDYLKVPIYTIKYYALGLLRSSKD